jgi:hypothetical protein
MVLEVSGETFISMSHSSFARLAAAPLLSRISFVIFRIRRMGDHDHFLFPSDRQAGAQSKSNIHSSFILI